MSRGLLEFSGGSGDDERDLTVLFGSEESQLTVARAQSAGLRWRVGASGGVPVPDGLQTTERVLVQGLQSGLVLP